MSQDKTTVVRVEKKRENPYVMIDKYGLEDDRISFRAKGLLAYLLSKPDHWKVMICDLVKHGKEGRDAIYKAIKELIELGYMKRDQIRDKGRIVGTEYTVFERPQETLPHPEKPYTVKPDTVKPDTVNPPLVINDSSNNDLSNKSLEKKMSQSVKTPLTDRLTDLNFSIELAIKIQNIATEMNLSDRQAIQAFELTIESADKKKLYFFNYLRVVFKEKAQIVKNTDKSFTKYQELTEQHPAIQVAKPIIEKGNKNKLPKSIITQDILEVLQDHFQINRLQAVKLMDEVGIEV